jgi:DNA mismatch repair protein PMS2
MSIQPLPASSVHQISSGQVVPSLQSAVKELLENALDAGASSIEIRLVDHGTTSIEVIDNGSGVPGASLKFLGKRSCTSKLDVDLETPLDSVRTFGFRGEALNSLIAICERVSVTTATVEDAPLGNHIDDLARYIEGTDQFGVDKDASKVNEKLKRVARQVSTRLFQPTGVS